MFHSLRAQFARCGWLRSVGGEPLRRLVRQQQGSAAVEFALVAVPFLALTFAILETALIFFAGQALETAAADSARLIMTGQAQTKSFNKEAFKEAVCARIYGLFDCKNGVYVDVRTFSSSGNVNLPSPVDANGNFQDSTYQPGGPGDFVIVRLFYKWPVFVSLMGNLSNIKGGGHLLAATIAFRNEPYASSTTASTN